MQKQQICKICGKQFSLKKHKQQFCSRLCSAKARSTSYEKECCYCGKAFLTHPSADAKFCSQRCCGDWQHGQKRVERQIKLCVFCGKEMIGTPSNLEKIKFCSRRCSGKNKTKKAGHNPDLNRQCVVCGNSFLVSKPCSKQKCCSHECGCQLQFLEHNKQLEQLLPEIKEYRKTHSPVETAEEFATSHAMLLKMGVIGASEEKRRSCPDYLTQEQIETITGNLLGDGCLSYIKKDGYNSHFSIGQKGERAEYVNGLVDIYAPFSCGTHERQNRKPSRVNGKINHDIENWDGEYVSSIMMYTVNHSVFTTLRQKWYNDPDIKRSPKIIPADLRLTWRTAAIWMCDDGTNHIKRHRSLALYTDCFSHERVEFLVELIKRDLSINAHINLRDGKPVIKIYGDEWFEFIERIKPFIPWKCFQYKCTNRHALKNGMWKGSPQWLAQKERGKQRLLTVLAKRGWKLLSEYTDREMQVQCEHGKVFSRIRASLMQADARCDCDSDKNRIERGRLRRQKGEQDFLNLMFEKGWKLESQYQGRCSRAILRCQHGEKFQRWICNVNLNSKCDCNFS